jgi:hypothetical protein
LKEIPVRRLRERFPDRILRHAVHGMLPKNRVRHVREDRLILLTGVTHAHNSQVVQNPWKLAFGSKSRVTGLPSVSGFFISLVDTGDAVKIEGTPFQPESEKKLLAEKARKAHLQKQLKAYLLGRGERPDFLPQATNEAEQKV